MGEPLLFKNLDVGELFKVEESPKVFQKIPKRKRSWQRPFACNAKVVIPSSSNALKQGYFLEDTIVYKYVRGT